MKKILIISTFFCLGISLQAQQSDPSPLEPILKRTYPIDSCLWFMLPFDFEVRQTRTFGGGNTGVLVSFSSTSPTGSITRGQGRFLVSSEQFPVAGWNWLAGQQGKIQIILPDSAQGGGSQDLTGESNFNNFPILTTGFLLDVEENSLSPPFQINFRLTALETEL